MDQMIVPRASTLFNGPLETGVRALVLLDAFHPRPCDLTEVTWLDHLVVHTSDLGRSDGSEVPSSLHPDLPGRQGELLVRRELIEHSLRLMHRLHLVDVKGSGDGIQYLASEDAPSFLGLLQSPYNRDLKARATWLATRLGDLSTVDIRAEVERQVGRWTAEFLGAEA